MTTIACYLLVYMLAVVHCSSREEVYFVKPTEDGDCDGRQPCDTLSGYVEQGTGFQKSNITFQLCSGIHEIFSDLEFVHFANLSFHGVSGLVSQLQCHQNVFLTFTDGFELNVDSIKLSNCAIEANDIHKFEIHSCMFQGSQMTAVWVNQASSFHISDSLFDSNINMEPLYDGGALYVSDANSVQITSTNFTNNVCYSGSGGAVYIMDVQSVFLLNTCFINNSAYQGSCGVGCGKGGALVVYGLDSPKKDINTRVILEGVVVFENNSAEVLASSIAMYFVRVTINGSDECMFRYNSVHIEGATAAFMDSNVFFRNCYFHNNKGNDIGALFVGRSSLSIMQGFFTENSIASKSGSAVGIEGCNSVTIVNSVFQNNSVANGSGGAVAIVTSRELNITNNSFIANTVFHGSAGAILIRDSSELFMSDISFRDNVVFRGVVDADFIDVSKQHLITNSTSSENVSIDGNGGAIVVFNSTNLTIAKSTFESNLALHSNFGGAVAMLESSNVTFKDTLFKENEGYIGGGLVLEYSQVIFRGDTYLVKNAARMQGGGIYTNGSIVSFTGNIFVIKNTAENVSGGGMCFIGSKIEFNAEVTKFEGCQAHRDGGGLYAANSQVYFSGKTLELNKNYAARSGGGMLCSNVSLNINCKLWTRFLNNIAMGKGGALMADTPAGAASSGHISINGNVLFRHNRALAGGALCLYVDAFISGNIQALNNKACIEGGWLTSSGAKITISGQSLRVEHNSASNGGALSGYVTRFDFGVRKIVLRSNNASNHGGAMLLRTSELSLSSYKNFFIANSAQFGGGINLAGKSSIFLFKTATLFFVHNTATIGGALFINDHVNSENCEDSGPECFFSMIQSLFNKIEKNSPIDSILFFQNYAKRGSDLYGGMLDRCTVFHPESYKPYPGARTWFLLTNSTNGSTSSDPSRICVCMHMQATPNCESENQVLLVYRGQQSNVSVAVLDQLKNFAPFPIIRARFSNGILGEGEYIQNISKQGDWPKCGQLTFHFFSSNEKAVLTLYSDQAPCRDTINISTLEIPIQFLPCPLGFQLSDDGMKCVCHKPLLEYTTSCNIDSQSIVRNGRFWFSYENRSLVVHPHCPFDYCIQKPESISAADIDKQCAFNRSGALCGACGTNLSLSLGSSRCQPCHSPSFVWLTLLFALAGVFLVAFLSVFKFTVSVGTLNGLIFFSNIVMINKSLMFPSGSTSNPLLVLLAWLNLDLGIETCYYDGMDMYGRTWLQFVFPLYVWSMVGLIIIVSHYSTYAAKLFGRNPVAVLATLFLLSYTKLLKTIITIFSVGFMQYPETGKRRAVWLYDANVGFLQGKHIPLFITALLVLVLLFLPYTIALLLGQCLRQQSGKKCLHWARSPVFTSVMDAYHAPYKNKHRYWTGLLLIVRCALFLTFSFNVLGDPEINLVAVSITSLLIGILAAYLKVYKNKILNFLELFFLANMGILSVLFHPTSFSEVDKERVNTVSLSIVFLVFCGLLVYHSYIQIKDTSFWRKIQQRRRKPITREPITEQEEAYPKNEPTISVVELRNSKLLEPLLEDST